MIGSKRAKLGRVRGHTSSSRSTTSPHTCYLDMKWIQSPDCPGDCCNKLQFFPFTSHNSWVNFDFKVGLTVPLSPSGWLAQTFRPYHIMLASLKYSIIHLPFFSLVRIPTTYDGCSFSKFKAWMDKLNPPLKKDTATIMSEWKEPQLVPSGAWPE